MIFSTQFNLKTVGANWLVFVGALLIALLLFPSLGEAATGGYNNDTTFNDIFVTIYRMLGGSGGKLIALLSFGFLLVAAISGRLSLKLFLLPFLLATIIWGGAYGISLVMLQTTFSAVI